MTERENRWLEYLMILATVGLTVALLVFSFNTGKGTGTWLGAYSAGWMGAIFIEAAVALCSLGLLFFWGTRFRIKITRLYSSTLRQLTGRRWLSILVLVGIPVGLWWLIYQSQPDRLGEPLPRWWLLWMGALIGAVPIQSLAKKFAYFHAFLGGLVYIALFYVAVGFFVQVTPYPFSLGWSEGSRYYNASLFFAQSVYGQGLPLPVLHPTRYLLQSIPFLIPGTQIAFHRFWQALLWMALPGLGSWLLVRRLRLDGRLTITLTAIFAYLFFYQGPIYYHLMVCAIPVLIVFNPRKPWQTLIWVLLASIWAGLSRVNWWPVPGALAALLFLLEERVERQSVIRYARWPFIWGVAGTLTAFIANQVYEKLSGNPPEVFGSALESPLLWERLWPNTTYGPGIVLMTLLVIIPGLLVFIARLAGKNRWHWLRLAGIFSALLAFLLGGLIVSVKIGGGSNLHNLDAFLLLFGVALLYIGLQRFTADQPAAGPVQYRMGHALLAALVVIVPIAQSVYGSAPLRLPDADKTADNLRSLQIQTADASSRGEVLFLTEKQLVTFKMLDVPNFDPEHEKVFLMEMAMANNQAYLQKFYTDLKNHRYSMIVAEPLNANLQDSTYAFAEENNAWVERVELPVLQYYEVLDKMPENEVVLYVPKQP